MNSWRVAGVALVLAALAAGFFSAPATAGHAPVIRVYKDSNAWFGEEREAATLTALGKVLGDDWFEHAVADCQAGIPGDTAVVLFTSNGIGLPSARIAQNHPACQASLARFLDAGGIVIVDMGDNDFAGGYQAPGAIGTPSNVFPDPCGDATLAPAAAGGDGLYGTADDHALVRGPDGAAGTADDLTNGNIDMNGVCYVAHGNLADGISLPAEATTLMTATFRGVQKPIVAEYCYGNGRVVLDTLTKEFYGQQPPGVGPSYFLLSLLSYALGPESACVLGVEIDVKPGGDENPIKLSARGVTPVAILTTAEFDAAGVDPTSVCFGDAEAPAERSCSEVHGRGHLEDVDGDGDVDLVLHFDTRSTGIDPGDEQACLSGRTYAGRRIAGCDAIRTL